MAAFGLASRSLGALGGEPLADRRAADAAPRAAPLQILVIGVTWWAARA